MAERLQWDGDRAVASDGVSYVLGSEDYLGRHGGRIWHVYVYADPTRGASEVLTTEQGDKRSARRRAQRHVDERVKA